MSRPRFYVPREDISGDRAVIRGDQARHLVSVLRKKPGDEVALFDGQGVECTARIVRISRDSVVAEVEGRDVQQRAGRPMIGMYVAVPKGRRFDLIVEKATELGADSITPMVTGRSVVKLSDRTVSTKLDRWRRICIAAAKQCRRTALPRINPPVDFQGAIQGLPEWVLPILALSLGDSPPIYHVLREVKPVHREVRIYVGPEGGFTPEETETARKAGMRLASLGENVLRTETAAIASLSAISCFLDSHLKDSAPVVGT